MFQKKLNLTPLGPGLPKIQVCVAIQKLSPSPVIVPFPLWATQACLQGCGGTLGQTFSGSFGCLQPQNHQHGRKVLSGSVP